MRIGVIELRLETEQEVSLARLFEHLTGIGTGRQRPAGMTTDDIGRLTEKTDGSARQLAKFECQNMQLRCLRRLRRDIAKEDCTLFAFKEALCDFLAALANLDILQAGRSG